MNILSEAENQVVDQLRLAFYEIVPSELRTYCSLTSRISQAVLNRFSIQNELMPCQLWYSSETQNYVVGFLENQKQSAEWNGHVVCRAGNVIMDAATQNLEVKLGVKVPCVVVARRFMVSTQLISRARLQNNAILEWFYPPRGLDVLPPEEPSEMIEKYAHLLFEKISKSNQ